MEIPRFSTKVGLHRAVEKRVVVFHQVAPLCMICINGNEYNRHVYTTTRR